MTAALKRQTYYEHTIHNGEEQKQHVPFLYVLINKQN